MPTRTFDTILIESDPKADQEDFGPEGVLAAEGLFSTPKPADIHEFPFTPEKKRKPQKFKTR